ncbi:hypothetical protein CPB86DRAFT_764371 [Serendipita vermifera]|nr:hypothetical protein CPB86DRAFT_764371 [Serendipita vermifera]
MFRVTIQPPTVSLFSSDGQSPLEHLWAQHTDSKLPEDSFIYLVDDTMTGMDDATEEALGDLNPVKLPKDYNGTTGKSLGNRVLHIQSPTIATTYILSPPTGELALRHRWVHLQLRNLHKEMSFEIGFSDTRERRGRIRWSTFQQFSPMNTGPLLHLPLSFPPATSKPLTAWSTVDVDVATLIPTFTSPILLSSISAQFDLGQFPSGAFSHISYVKIYANCRLRRVWLSEQNGGTWPEEFQLYGSIASS